MASGTSRPNWRLDGRDWPNRATSRFVEAAGLRWHVQVMGRGRVILLLHGTGAATHSWRDLAPLLAEDAQIVAPDLPGHGFTDSPPPRRLSLAGMARDIAELLRVLEMRPALAVGHSAGAAVAIEMALEGLIAPQGIVSLNGALLPYRDSANPLFSAFARLFALNPFVPRLFSWRAGRLAAAERLIGQTGSRIDAAGLEFYRRLLARPGHCAAALHMMANWRLEPLVARLSQLEPSLRLVVAEKDRAVPPSVGRRIASRLPTAEVIALPGLGHLAHEEDPEGVAKIILDSLEASKGHDAANG